MQFFSMFRIETMLYELLYSISICLIILIYFFIGVTTDTLYDISNSTVLFFKNCSFL